jgi:hypothetical protein
MTKRKNGKPIGHPNIHSPIPRAANDAADNPESSLPPEIGEREENPSRRSERLNNPSNSTTLRGNRGDSDRGHERIE